MDQNQITTNFHVIHDNMACPCCGGFVYDKTFMRLIQVLRDIVGVPFRLSKTGGGFYRCRFYNDKLPGAAPSSQHLHGRAMDVLTDGWSDALKWRFISEATKLGMSFKRYDGWIHVDLRPGDPVAF